MITEDQYKEVIDKLYLEWLESKTELSFSEWLRMEN